MPSEALIERINGALKRHRLKVYDLAKITGLPRTTLQNIKLRRDRTSETKLDLIEKALDKLDGPAPVATVRPATLDDILAELKAIRYLLQTQSRIN